jgi:hypothetical protein
MPVICIDARLIEVVANYTFVPADARANEQSVRAKSVLHLNTGHSFRASARPKCHQLTSTPAIRMTALLPITDIVRLHAQVRFVPRGDIRPGASLHFRTDGNANCAGRRLAARGGIASKTSGEEAIEAFPLSRRACSTSFACDVQPTGPGIQ